MPVRRFLAAVLSLLVDRYGRSQAIADLPRGSGDMGFDPLPGRVVVPRWLLMADGKVAAYRID